ncbi:MAG: dihydrofolate reductase [Huintestinicola sp.]
MIAIVAAAEDFGIGKDNDLLFNIPADKKFFREKTVGSTVVMGRKTFQSLPFGKPLKDRENVVLTRDPDFTAEGAEICHSTEELFFLLCNRESDKVFLIGGAEIYGLLLDKCDKAYVTKIEKAVPADKFFPNIDKLPGWKMTEQSEEMEHEGIKFRFCTYEKI